MGSDQEFRRQRTQGLLEEVVRGVYVESGAWLNASWRERYRVRIEAVARLHPDTVFSHESAALIWDLPLLRSPARVHSRVPTDSTRESTTLLRRHAIGNDPAATVRNGLRVTSLATTLADACTIADRAAAMCIVDAGLRVDPGDNTRAVPTKAQVIAEIRALRTAPGAVRAVRALDFADARAESPGESVTRVQLHALGFPTPQLQVAFDDDRGRIGTVDFFWPEHRLIAEFDGAVKYGDQRRFAKHLTAAEILVEEKRREDRLRALDLGMVRLDWSTVLDRGRLARALPLDRSVGRRSAP